MFTRIRVLLAHEIKSEWKQRYAVFGLLLFVLSTVYVSYLAFQGSLEPRTWNALLWIILLLASVNAATGSFHKETHGRYWLFYQITDPRSIILSKTIYNMLLMWLLALLAWFCFIIFLGNPVANSPLYLAALLLGSSGFAGTLSVMSSISARTQQNTALLAILSIPIILPLFLVSLTLSNAALLGLSYELWWRSLLVIVLLNAVTLLLSYLLFPYLWRD